MSVVVEPSACLGRRAVLGWARAAVRLGALVVFGAPGAAVAVAATGGSFVAGPANPAAGLLPKSPTPAALQAACDAPGFASVLRPAAQQRAARAVWLDRYTLQWPAAAPAGPGLSYRLHHAAGGGLLALPGALVRGSGGAFTLKAPTRPLPAAVQQRFRHLAAGAQLQLDPARVNTAALRHLHRGELLLVQQDSVGRVLQATALQSPGALDDLYAAAENATDLGVAVWPAASRSPS